MNRFNFKNSSIIIYIVISVFYAICNFIWWKINTPVIPQGICALHFLDIFENTFLYFNAPLITWIMKGMFFIFGKEYFDLQIIFVNYIFFLIALYFIYKIGFEIEDIKTGNIAMILFALTPAIYGMSRQYGHQEYHVMVAMTANIYCLIKLKNFEDRKWSILYGITVGLGLLIKDEFLPYFFIPWLYVVIRSLIEKSYAERIINIFITITVGSLIAGCHYFNLGIIGKILHEPFRETVNIFSYENIRMLTLGLGDELLSFPIFLSFLVSLIWFIVKYTNKNKWIILLWIIIPWLIIMFMPHHKEPEYNVGFIPAIILITALFFSYVKNKIGIIIFGILTFCCILQFVDLSYNNKAPIFFKFNKSRYNLLSYDIEKRLNIVELIEILKTYGNKSFYIYNIDGYIIENHTLLTFINLNNLKTAHNIQEADIVICNGKERSLEERAENDFILSSIAFFADKNMKESFIGKKIEEHKLIKDKLIKDFYLDKSFYLQNIEDERYFVGLYKKKNDI